MFAELYTKYYPLLLKQALSICGSRELAEDAIQNSVLRLANKTDLLRSLPRPARVSYLVKTVKCSALNLITRDERRRYYGWDDLPEESVEDKTPESLYLLKERIKSFQSCLESLNERDKDLLYFRYFLELDNKTVSQIMGIPYPQVPVYLHYAKQRFLKRWKEVNL